MLERPISDIELEEIEKAKKIRRNATAEVVAAKIDFANLGAIFGAIFLHLLSETMKHICFPFAMGISIIRALLAIRQAWLEGRKSHGTIVRAGVEVGVALAVTVAVVGSLALQVVFAAVAPIIFTATLGLKSLYHLFSTGWYLGKSWNETDSAKKDKYIEQAKGHAIGFLATAFATVAVGLAMIAHKVTFGVFGLVTTGLGIGYTSYRLYQEHKAEKAEAVKAKEAVQQQVEKEDNELINQLKNKPGQNNGSSKKIIKAINQSGYIVNISNGIVKKVLPPLLPTREQEEKIIQERVERLNAAEKRIENKAVNPNYSMLFGAEKEKKVKNSSSLSKK